MSSSSRRGFLLGMAGSAAGAPSPFAPVFGLQSNTLRGRTIEEVIATMQSVKMRVIELSSRHYEPADLNPAVLTKWRMAPNRLATLRDVRQKFAHAGILIHAVSMNIRPELKDEEIARMIAMANTLDARYVTTPCSSAFLPRLEMIARKQSIPIAIHNDGPETISSPQEIGAAVQNFPTTGIALDLGNAAAEGGDPLQVLRESLRHVRTIHLKDRKARGGPEVPLGEGDAALEGVLRLVKMRQLRIPLMLELEYKAGNPVAEITKALALCRQILRTRSAPPAKNN